MATSQNSLEHWLRLQATAKRPSGTITRVNVSHMPRTQSTGDELASYDAPVKIDDSWIAETVEAIEKVANADATEHGQNFQTYCIGVYRQRCPDHRVNRKLWRVRGVAKGDVGESDDFDTDENSESDEVLSSSGHILAEMSRRIAAMERHEETLFRSVIDDKGAAQKQQIRLIEQQGEQIRKLLDERAQMLEAAEEIMTAKMERDLAAEKEKNRSLLMGELVSEVKLLAPAIIGRITGVKAEGGVSPQIEALKRFKESLKPEQLPGLAKALTEAQQIAIMEILSMSDTN